MRTIIGVTAGLLLVAGQTAAATTHVDRGLGTPTACGAQWKHLHAINATGGLTRPQFMHQCVVKSTTANEAAGGEAAEGASNSTLIWTAVGVAAVGGIVAGVVVSNDNNNHASP